MSLRVARVPYLNTEPFFPEDASTLPFAVIPLPPRQLGEAAARGEIDAGLMPAADYFRLADRFELLGDLGLATRGTVQSVLLLSQKPLLQLNGCAIDVTGESSTSALLLRLILEQRYNIFPSSYHRANGEAGGAEAPSARASGTSSATNNGETPVPASVARLVIGDEALRLRARDRRMPYCIDLGDEWWLWQLLPFVFAAWVVRKDAPPSAKQELAGRLRESLEENLQTPQRIAARWTSTLGLSEEEIVRYLQGLRYRLDDEEREGMARFHRLLEAHQLL